MAVQKQAVPFLAAALPWAAAAFKNFVLPAIAMEGVSYLGGKLMGGQQGAAQAAKPNIPRLGYRQPYRPHGWTGHTRMASADRSIAFLNGIDKFCKEAGLDNEDREAMHRLIKAATGEDYSGGYLPGLDDDPRNKPSGKPDQSAGPSWADSWGSAVGSYYKDKLGVNDPATRNKVLKTLDTMSADGSPVATGITPVDETIGGMAGWLRSMYEGPNEYRTNTNKFVSDADRKRRLNEAVTAGRGPKTTPNRAYFTDRFGQGVAGIDTSKKPHEAGMVDKQMQIERDDFIRQLSSNIHINPVSLATAKFGRKGAFRDSGIAALEAAAKDPNNSPDKKMALEMALARVRPLHSEYKKQQAQGAAGAAQAPAEQLNAPPRAQRAINPAWERGRQARMAQNEEYNQRLSERQKAQAARTAQYQANRPGAAGTALEGKTSVPPPSQPSAPAAPSRPSGIYTTPELSAELQSRGWGSTGTGLGDMTGVSAPVARSSIRPPVPAAPQVAAAPAASAPANLPAPVSANIPKSPVPAAVPPASIPTIPSVGEQSASSGSAPSASSMFQPVQSDLEKRVMGLGLGGADPDMVARNRRAADVHNQATNSAIMGSNSASPAGSAAGPAPSSSYVMPSAEKMRELMTVPSYKQPEETKLPSGWRWNPRTVEQRTNHGHEPLFTAKTHGSAENADRWNRLYDADRQKKEVAAPSGYTGQPSVYVPPVSRPELRYKDMELPGAAGRAASGALDWFTKQTPDWKNYGQMGVPRAEFAERYKRMKLQEAQAARSATPPAPAAPAATAPEFSGMHFEAPAWFGRVFGGKSPQQPPTGITQTPNPVKQQPEVAGG